MRTLVFTITLFISLISFGQSQKPKLVVGIVVDQMRNDYLQRYQANFSELGFRRMMNEGFVSRNTHYNYTPTYTAPGHASIYTGTTPKNHGIISNSWYSRSLDRSIYCVEDTLAKSIGGSERNGAISPRNLLSNTITDELKLSTNFRSKVVGISIKDRGAVLPAGHVPEGCYWYDSGTGEFMTSDFYKSALPDWVQKFNNRKLVEKYMSGKWEPLLPLKEYVQSQPDNSPYEYGFRGKETPSFPYDLAKLDVKPNDLIRSTPFGNSLLFELAKATIEGEGLGKDQVTDFLALSLSSPDYIGHNFGPNSVEVEDTYLRLDRDLAEFLSYLDQTIGKGQYLIFLTADHGAVANPQFLVDRNLPGGFIDGEEAKNTVGRLSIEKYGDLALISDISNDQIYLDRELIKAEGLNLEEVQNFYASAALQVPAVAEALTASNLARLDYTDPLRLIAQNGYNTKLSGDVILIMKPGYLGGKPGNKGTSHGSGFTYDTHVPLLFFGTGVRQGATVEKVTISDIAPTIAMLLDISMPNAAVSGQPIEDLFE